MSVPEFVGVQFLFLHKRNPIPTITTNELKATAIALELWTPTNLCVSPAVSL